MTGARRGRIDDFDVAHLDLVSLAPDTASNFVAGGFRYDADHFRRELFKWGMNGLGRVADVGCGYGRWSFFLAETNEAVVGYDRVAKRLKLGEALAATFDLPNIDFVAAEADDLPAESGSFDGVWCFNALPFMDRAAMLAQAHRVLRPGGVLCLTAYTGLGKVLETFIAGYREGGLSHRMARFALRSLALDPATHDGDANYADAGSLKAVLERHGFEIDPARPVDVEMSELVVDGDAEAFADLIADPPALAARLVADPAFADAFVANPRIADAYPFWIGARALRKSLPERRSSPARSQTGTPMAELTRLGNIDDFDLKTLDIAAISGAAGSPFVDAGFKAGADHYRKTVEKWGMHGFGRVADIGCGYGRWSFFLAEVNDRVTGFDRLADRLALGETLKGQFGLPNIDFVQTDVTAMDAEDESFDAAWCFNALQFVNRRKCLSEINRILKPGGQMFLGVYEGLGKVMEKFHTGYAKGGLDHRITKFAIDSIAMDQSKDEGVANYGDPASIAAVLERHGFALNADWPMDVEMSKKPADAVTFAELATDPPALAARLRDPAFAAEFAARPEVANAYPMFLHLRATKVGPVMA